MKLLLQIVKNEIRMFILLPRKIELKSYVKNKDN